MRQVSLVALYGDKETEISKLIGECQARVSAALGSAFSPYDLRQVHATVVGLERRPGSTRDNANFWKYRGRRTEMDFGGFLDFLRSCSQIPFEVRIGGFENRDYPFVSDPFEKGTDSRPYERTFSVQGDRVVVMGWPVRGNSMYPLSLDDIRRVAQKFGILHAYHRTLTAVDNDYFFRIGLVDRKQTASFDLDALAHQMRESLAGADKPISSVITQVTLDDVFVAAYEDDTLPVASTKVWPLADKSINAEFVESLFGGTDGTPGR
jgi:hypothetical protein